MAYQQRRPTGRHRVRKRVFQTGAGVEVDSEAFYIEDKWQITDNFLAYRRPALG